MKCGEFLGAIAIISLIAAACGAAIAEDQSSDNSYYYVANTRPPDAFLALRTHPTTGAGLRITTMPNGTYLRVLQKHPDGWWRVRVVPSGQEGWALSGDGNRQWIECCATASINRTAEPLEREPNGFKLPSNNIHCQFDDGAPGATGYLRCDVRQIVGVVPPRPRECELSWGHAFAILEKAQSGERICYGDTIVDDKLVTLTYGNTWRRNGYTCNAQESGLTCTNVQGHGFWLTKNSQRLF